MIEAAITAAFTVAGLLLGVAAAAKPSYVLFALIYAAAGAALLAAVRAAEPRLAGADVPPAAAKPAPVKPEPAHAEAA